MQAKNYSPESGNGQAQADDAAPSTALSQRDTPAVPGEVRSFVADVGDLIKATTTLSGEDLARARAHLIERAVAARASLERMGGVISDRARQTAKATDTYVHDRPWQALGIGAALSAALGMAIGILLARRRG